MKTQSRTTRTTGLVAVLAAGAMTLSACSGGSDSASSGTTSSTTSTTSSTSSSTPSSSSTTTSSTSSATTSTASPTSTGASQALITSCVNANTRSNAAMTQWNNAVRTQLTVDLDNAAKNFRTTATYLRTLTKAPADKAFTPLVLAVAKDLDAMADARKNRETVSGSQYNSDAQKLRTYCTNKIKA